jgi:hypothetical protein
MSFGVADTETISRSSAPQSAQNRFSGAASTSHFGQLSLLKTSSARTEMYFRAGLGYRCRSSKYSKISVEWHSAISPPTSVGTWPMGLIESISAGFFVIPFIGSRRQRESGRSAITKRVSRTRERPACLPPKTCIEVTAASQLDVRTACSATKVRCQRGAYPRKG